MKNLEAGDFFDMPVQNCGNRLPDNLNGTFIDLPNLANISLVLIHIPKELQHTECAKHPEEKLIETCRHETMSFEKLRRKVENQIDGNAFTSTKSRFCSQEKSKFIL